MEIRLHHDYNEGLSPSRKLTMVIQLSDPSEYEGGQLELFEDIQIPKQKGLRNVPFICLP